MSIILCLLHGINNLCQLSPIKIVPSFGKSSLSKLVIVTLSIGFWF